MRKRNSYKNTFTVSAKLHLLVSIIIVIIAFLVSNKITPETIKSVPWSLVALLLLPTGHCITFLTKLSEVKENIIDYLSRNEIRRLDIIIDKKKANSLRMLIFQLFIACINILLSNGVLPEPFIKYQKILVCVLIGLTISSLYLVIPSILGIFEISNFKAEIKNRKIRKKRKNDALKNLQ